MRDIVRFVLKVLLIVLIVASCTTSVAWLGEVTVTNSHQPYKDNNHTIEEYQDIPYPYSKQPYNYGD